MLLSEAAASASEAEKIVSIQHPMCSIRKRNLIARRPEGDPFCQISRVHTSGKEDFVGSWHFVGAPARKKNNPAARSGNSLSRGLAWNDDKLFCSRALPCVCVAFQSVGLVHSRLLWGNFTAYTRRHTGLGYGSGRSRKKKSVSFLRLPLPLLASPSFPGCFFTPRGGESCHGKKKETQPEITVPTDDGEGVVCVRDLPRSLPLPFARKVREG